MKSFTKLLSKNKSLEKLLAKGSGTIDDDLALLKKGPWPPVVLFRGWMTKQGNVMKNWKKRYFLLLSPNVLCYFEKEAIARAVEHLYSPTISSLKDLITGTAILTPETEIKEVGGDDNIWQLKVGSRTFVFKCDTHMEMTSWINQCRLAQNNRSVDVVPSDSVEPGTGEQSVTNANSAAAASSVAVASSGSAAVVAQGEGRPSASRGVYETAEEAYGYNVDEKEVESYRKHADQPDYETLNEGYGMYMTDGYENLYEETENEKPDLTASKLSTFRLDVPNLDPFDEKIVETVDLSVVKKGSKSSLQAWTEEMVQRDWNEEYQLLEEMNVSTPYDLEQVTKDKENLVAQFLEFSAAVAEVISGEVATPYSDKTLKPLDGAGIAGGEKFKLGNVFFKFARDDKGLYPCDMYAQKAASNEVRAMSAIRECHINGLHTTLTCLFYKRGHCVIATAVAPIGGSPNTIIYGSDDASKTIHKSNTMFNELARKIADKLHLKEHVVTAVNSVVLSPEAKLAQRTSGIQANQTQLDLAVDVEGHLGRDGRFFLVDLARLFPPTVPKGKEVWFNHFRPEFMRDHCSTKLSDDAFTGFGRHGYEEHHPEVREEYKRLMTETVPSVAKVLLQQVELFDLSSVLHKNGVNVRYSYDVMSHIPTDGSDTSQAQRAAIWADMIARCVKQRARRMFRSLSKVHSSTLVLNQVVSLMLDAVVNKSSLTDVVWNLVIRSDLYVKYKVQVDVDDDEYFMFHPTSSHPKSWPKKLYPTPRALLMIALVKQLGLSAALDVEDIKSDKDVSQSVSKLIKYLKSGEKALDKKKVVKILPFLRFAEAEAAQLENLRIRESTLGKDHPSIRSTIKALVTLYMFWSGEDPVGTKAKALVLLDRLTSITQSLDGLEQFQDYNFAGNAMKLMSDPNRALDYYNSAIASFKAKYGENVMSGELAGMFDNKGQILNTLGRHKESLEVLQIALAARQQLFGLNHQAVATTLSSIGGVLEASGQMQQSIPYFEEAIRIMELIRKGDPGVAKIYLSVSSAYQRIGAYAKGVEAANHALRIAREAYGNDNMYTGAALVAAGMSLNKLQKTEEAHELLKEGVEILEKTSGADALFTIIGVSGLGDIALSQDRPQDGVEHYMKAYTLCAETMGEDHPHVSMYMANIGAAYMKMEKMEEALEWQLKSTEAKKKVFGENHPEVIQNYCNLASTYTVMGYYTKAVELLQIDIENTVKMGGPQSGELVAPYHTIGMTMRKSGANLEQAIQYSQAAANLANAMYGVNPNTAAALNNAAMCLLLLGRYEECGAVLTQAAAFTQQSVGMAHLMGSIILETNSRLLSAVGGRSTEAIQLAEQSIAVAVQNMGENNRDHGRTLDCLGVAYLSGGEVDKALETLLRAVDMRQAAFKREAHPMVGDTQVNIAQAYLAKGNLTEADKYVQKAISTFRAMDVPALEKKALVLRLQILQAEGNAAKIEECESQINNVRPYQK